MKYREDKRTGSALSLLGFGCMRFPTNSLGRIDMAKTEELILAAVEGGINYFDTAYMYSGSEAALGQILEKHGLRDQVFIATKLPIILCRNNGDFDKYFETQLQRLKTDRIDYYFLHMLSSPEQWEKLKSMGILEWIAAKKSSGQIGQIGFSFHGKRDDFTALIDDYEWDFCQIQYNYININYQAGITGLKYASQKGLPVFIMEPLLGGQLATGLPKEAVETFRLEDADATPAQWAFRWLYDQPEVTVVLSGMNQMAQLKENLAVVDASEPGMLTEREQETFGKVVEIFNNSYKIPCTGCNYCMPCPRGINIPACFAAYNASHSIGRFTGQQQYLTSTVATAEKRSARHCIKCGKCERHCPQNIPIMDSMTEVKKRMEPFWFGPAMGVVRRFT